MSNAYIIEVESHTAASSRGTSMLPLLFLRSDIDSLEGREFRSLRTAECAARALFLVRAR
ncbi:hypothetical protein FXV83_35185 [Bradyrhizobium hipponense]|uniref:Uncharacterized protein n=1 Tax=Bradyrhizobium hipponense TaxID=2605638 RepID=A0A5S4YE46_9BRAD|nr:hypothetical protein FXV83_35185 [Bradyrhizobium hipponense]